jgi:poly(hydroxyalkanoate) granule-associated protein
MSGDKPMDTETGTVSEEPKSKPENVHNPFFEASRKVLLASIGAVAVAQEELEDFIDKLIERGEIAEKDGKKLLRELMEKRKKRSREVEEEMSRKVRETLERMNIPTRADLEKLTTSVAALSQKIDELTKSRK